jgi:hypothetical protein
VGKNRQHAKRPGAIGPDGLSKYDRKCLNRASQSVVASTPKPLMAAKALPVDPTQSAAKVTEKVEAVFIGISEFVRTLKGEELFLPWRVLKESGVRLRKCQRILCEVTSPEAGHHRRQIVSLQPIA